MDWIIPLEEAAADIGTAGSKGANLGTLIEAGLPVAHGFVLTTAAYREFFGAGDLMPAIQSAAAGVDPDDPASAERAAGEIAARMSAAEMPAGMRAAIAAAYEAMQGVPVAVRSSIVTQEEPDQVFYGQGETVLNVLGQEAVIQAVRACWESLWSAPALIFRAGRAIPPQTASMAVVIQRMFRADISGVIMTVNAETRNPDEMVIRAAHGFGDAVLHGKVIPQEIVFNRYSRSITRQSSPGRLVILPDQALELARLGERIEHYFDCPQSIEWAWDEDTFCILQSRAIQVQIPPRIRWDPPHSGITYTRQGMVELLPRPVCTLFETCGLPELEGGILNYYTHLGETDTNTAGSFETIHGFVYRQEARGKFANLLALPRLRRAAEHANDHWEKEALVQYQQAVAEGNADPQALSPRELAQRITRLAQAAGRYWAVVNEMMAPLDQAEGRFRMLYARLAKTGDPDVSVFLCGLETRALQAERVFLAAAGGDLDAFLTKFGCAIYNLDFGQPLAGEDLSAWETARAAGALASAQERFLRLYGERITAEEHMQARLSGWQRRIFGPALNEAQRAVKAREDALFELGLAWRPLRLLAFELGRRLVEVGALQEPEHVFWLRRNELFVLAAALDEGKAHLMSQTAKVLARQAARQVAPDIEAPFTIPVNERQAVSDPLPSGEIKGQGISPGMVTGRARILRDSTDFAKLEKGDIIVAVAIPPAWTPLFTLAAGAVLDRGGAISCSSRTACLAGLPLVVETGSATHLIPDGATITVDGQEGVVIIGKKE
jgi:rifampicin phosphotransferase